MPSFGELIVAQLPSGAGENEDPVSFVLPVIRGPGYTHDTVLQRYIQGHAQVVANALKHAHVTEYIQVHLPDLSEASDEQLGSVDPADASELRKLDAIAFFTIQAEGLRVISSFFGHPYTRDVIIPDEHATFHEELGSAPPVKRDPPFFTFPTWSLTQWRTWATKVGGVDHPVIIDGKILVDIPKDLQDKWTESNVQSA
ncbi:hypothetical protein BX600DRAFT_440250 [Xylariales sp. PMI_506]|nr:hypothetical protein BX600DRAFT_440250 [Xylariales sp. PMI_506]